MAVTSSGISALNPVLNEFSLRGEVTYIKSFGSGHIHDTFLVKTLPEAEPDYILQRFNTLVFQDPDSTMRNIQRVTNHILNKLNNPSVSYTHKLVLHLIPLKNGSNFLRDSKGDVWRVFEYIPDHISYDRAEKKDSVYEGGKAFGEFLAMISDLSPDEFFETIPDFHNLDFRILQFQQALKNAAKERLKTAEREIRLITERTDEMRIIRELSLNGQIPRRLVHHDTKINNVLFSHDGKALCVIDLDTVMGGCVHDDFGDAIRTFTNTGEEDEADTTKVAMNIEFFEAFARGYLETARHLLNETEKKYLALSARTMTYMQVIRFLTDYLNGDTYYKIHFPGHNLQRTRAQIALLLSMEAQYPAMCRIIDSLS